MVCFLLFVFVVAVGWLVGCFSFCDLQKGVVTGVYKLYKWLQLSQKI